MFTLKSYLLPSCCIATLYIAKGRFSFDISVSWKFWETFATLGGDKFNLSR